MKRFNLVNIVAYTVVYASFLIVANLIYLFA
jgi:hypothetical protein